MRDAKVGEEVRKVRERNGATQAQLGEAIGLSATTISELESGDRRWTIDRIEKVAAHFGVDPGVFTGWAIDADAQAVAAAMRDGASLVVYAPTG